MHARLCNGAETSLPWKLLRTYRESCASIVQAVVAARPAAVSTKSVARRCSLKKSVQIHASSWQGHHCSVAQASFNHPRWYRVHPVCLLFTLETWPRGGLPHQKFHFRHFLWVFFVHVHVYLCICIHVNIYYDTSDTYIYINLKHWNMYRCKYMWISGNFSFSWVTWPPIIKLILKVTLKIRESAPDYCTPTGDGAAVYLLVDETSTCWLA